MRETWRSRVYDVLAEHELRSPGRTIVSTVLVASIVIGVAAAALITLPDLAAAQQRALAETIRLVAAIFTLEYLCRAWIAPESDPAGKERPWPSRQRYLRSFLGVVDLLVILPLWVGFVIPLAVDFADLAMLLALLKVARFTTSLPLVAAVFRNEGRSLLAGLMVMLVLLVLVSGLMYELERQAQPQTFSSIPATMWWAIVTMSTVGYGDMTPVTPFGKVFGGFTMLLGIAMFAVPAGILATGFATEIRKRDFVATWHTVAKVPLFASLDATQIGRASCRERV